MFKKPLFLFISLLLIFFILTSLSLLNRQILENDEGIYWATFLLADKGYSLYKEISFSQLPGFFISTFSIFKIFGSTIAAARFGIVYWTILAFLAITWLGHKRSNLGFSLLSIILLISTPVFFNQSITLQSDLIAVVFSSISFIFMTIYSSEKRKKSIFLIVSALFFGLALLTKFDFSLFLPFAFLLLTEKENRIMKTILFSVVTLIIILLTFNFFGSKEIISSVISLREKAAGIYPFNPSRTIELLKNEYFLLLLLLSNIFLAIFQRNKDRFWTSLFLWFFASLLLVFSFRPVFNHHLVFLTVPSVLLFANYFTSSKNTINRLIVFLVIGFSIFIFSKNYRALNNRQQSRIIKEREVAKNFILKHSEPADFIITDEAPLYGMTGRLSPPELVDLSEVQVISGNITREKIVSAVGSYKPKLILIWNGRLNPAKNFFYSLDGYKLVNIHNGKTILIRE